MAEVISPLNPYAAYVLIDPHADGDPYFTFGLIDYSGRNFSHYVRRKFIHDFRFHADQGKGECISIHHAAAGDFFLYGANLLRVWQQVDDIHDLMIFEPTYHQPVTDRSAPIFTHMEIENEAERFAQFQKQWALGYFPASLND